MRIPARLQWAEARYRNKIPRTGPRCGNTRDPCFGCCNTLHNRKTGVRRLFEYSTFPVLSQGRLAKPGYPGGLLYARRAGGSDPTARRFVLSGFRSPGLPSPPGGGGRAQKTSGTEQNRRGVHPMDDTREPIRTWEELIPLAYVAVI